MHGSITRKLGVPQGTGFELFRDSKICQIQWVTYCTRDSKTTKVSGTVAVARRFGRLVKLREGGYIRNKQHLKHIIIAFHGGGASNKTVDHEKALLEDLQPNSNLIRVTVFWANLPEGMRYLTSLRSLFIRDCGRLKSPPGLIRELISRVQLEIRGNALTGTRSALEIAVKAADELREKKEILCSESIQKDRMDLESAKSVAQSLHGALQCSELKELCSAWQYESELENLERTVATIKAVLLDAGGKYEHELSHQAQLWIEELTDAMGSDFSGSKLRTYLRVAKWFKIDDRLVLNGTRLRVLDLSYLKISTSLHMVGKLLHLRYLDLSGNLWLEELPESIVQLQNLQTLKLRGNHRLIKLPEDLSKLGKLRLLDLNDSNIESLPNSIGDLLHLAHLDLSGNDMLTELSESIMELHDLRTLRLKCCDQLRELPKDLSKLVKLRLLDITGCWEINAMPRGMQKLSCLQTLPLFVVGETNSNRKHCFADQLEGLKALNNLHGHLEIRFSIFQKATYVDENGRQGEYLRNKEHLTHITIDFKESDGGVDCEEALLEDLQPHSNLKRLQLSWYCGKRMPTWARKHSLGALLPQLVEIHLVYCDGLQCLPSLGILCHLKSLIVEAMSNLLYIENTSASSSSAAIASKSELESFFPSLEELKLEDLPKLKGWWSDNEIFYRSGRQERGVLPSFPRLLHLHIWRCPKLSCIPLCPTTERVTLGKSNRRLRIMESQCINSKLRIVYTEDIRCLNLALSVKTFSCLEQMEIRDDELESFSDVSELLRRCSFSLRSLVIDGCPNLRSLCGGLEYLAALETLHLRNLPNLNLSDGEYGEPWLRLRQSLRFLSLEHLHRLVTLPEEIHHLTSLQSLFIRGCRGLQSLPCSIRELFSLKLLEITDCSGLLKKRCQRVTGKDWCNIQHIPEIVITTEVDMDSDEDNDSEYSNESDSGHCL
ncbi:hypothetical protein Cgig2_010527 [Carnegiea gigantea]|uniref:Uncharacterized protein n=1 Tax=Carnegiea gigantea TaxID=171969 RepID=A0A9Q1KRS3_9CARY|nr:hypothetical protein Cgig2_010527 [Carnegiea gigantea]